MKSERKEKNWGKFFLGIVLPTLLAIILSIGSIYFFILPAFKDSFLESKKEMLRELTNVAWNILVFYEIEEREGRLSRAMAQQHAEEKIRYLRYGPENKDYFFITDLHPRMIMHPYSPELEKTDLSSYRDPDGLPIFVEMKELAQKMESGFLNYTWHTKYDNQQPVPKLSFVKQFAPWQWVLGTGVFLDDVETKMKVITHRITSMFAATVFLFTLLLLFVSQQSFRIERKRRVAEDKLKLSREKYKVLAETATDPMIMIHDSTIIYVNKSMYSMLHYTQEEMYELSPWQLFPDSCDNRESGMHTFSDALRGKIVEQKHEGLLSDRNGSLINVELSFSLMKLGDQEALVMTARDNRPGGLQSAGINEARERFNHLSSKLALGFFRVTAEEDLLLEEANDIASGYFGLSTEDTAATCSLLELFADINEREEVRKILQQNEDVIEKTVQLKALDNGSRATYALSLIGFANHLSQTQYYEGIIKDITQKKKQDQIRENLIVELQTSLLFLNQPIKYSLRNFVACTIDTSISEATRIMAKNRQSSILVTSESGEMIGIITDMVLRERVIAENLPYETPVYKVMSSPLIYIDNSALIFEAVLLMQEKNIKHLVVNNSSGETISVISNEELLNVHRYSSSFILSHIGEASTIDEIVEIQPQIPRIVKSLADSGAHAKNITRVITKISDTILEKIIDLTIEELGEPPKRFAFISVGSEGRGEQTLVTDQDNALIFEDFNADEEDSVRAYFLEFGKRVCTALDKAGYDLCKGEIMAMNPRWCQPKSVWDDYFTEWIEKGAPQDLLEVNIFFDLRSLYGDHTFVTDLRQTIANLVEARAPFLQHLAKNALTFRPPLDFFGKIHAESGEHSNSFDIKKVIACIVGFARVYAIKNGLSCTNTVERIEQLHKMDIINNATFDEITESYDYLMKLRFLHQVKMIDIDETPDNYLEIDSLSHTDKVMLKKIFSQVASMQKSMSYDFSGVA